MLIIVDWSFMYKEPWKKWERIAVVLLHIMNLSILIGLAYLKIAPLRFFAYKINTIQKYISVVIRRQSTETTYQWLQFLLNLLPTQNALYKQSTVIDFGISGSKLVKQGLSRYEGMVMVGFRAVSFVSWNIFSWHRTEPFSYLSCLVFFHFPAFQIIHKILLLNRYNCKSHAVVKLIFGKN